MTGKARGETKSKSSVTVSECHYMLDRKSRNSYMNRSAVKEELYNQQTAFSECRHTKTCLTVIFVFLCDCISEKTSHTLPAKIQPSL